MSSPAFYGKTIGTRSSTASVGQPPIEARDVSPLDAFSEAVTAIDVKNVFYVF